MKSFSAKATRVTVYAAALSVLLAVAGWRIMQYRGMKRSDSNLTSTPRAGSAEIQFVPSLYEFGRTPVFSGDKVFFTAAITNTSPVPVQLTSFPKTCGCVAIGENAELKLPVVLNPGETFPVRVEVSTDGKTGKQTIEVRAEGSMMSGEPLPSALLAIRGHVWSSIVTLPDDLFVEVSRRDRDVAIVRTVVLSDEWPGEGLAIAKITSTAGKQMRFELAPATGKALVRGLDVQKRRQMTIRYSIPSGTQAFDETITVTPVLAAAKPGTIRLHGRVLPDFETNLDHIYVFERRPGATVSRILTYRFQRPELRDFQLVGGPEEITLTEIGKPARDTRCFRVTCHLPRRVGTHERVLVFRVGAGTESIRIPVTMIVGSETRRKGG